MEGIEEKEEAAGSRYSEKYQGFVKVTVFVTQCSSLAYQVPQLDGDAQLYLLDAGDFGQVVLASLVKENCNIMTLSSETVKEFANITDISQVPSSVLTPLIPVLAEARIEANVPLNPVNWSYVLDGRFAKCCPRIQCSECKMKRLVTPKVLVKYKGNPMFTCKNMGLTCFSFVQTKPCDALDVVESMSEEVKHGVSSKESQTPSKNIEFSMFSRCPSSEPRLFESSNQSSKSFSTSLSPSDAFNRGPRIDKLQYAMPTSAERDEYSEIVKENPNVFGIRALGKLAVSDQAPTYSAEKAISAWLTWKSAWEGLFAKHGVSNPIAQAQVAMLSLKGEAQDWWNARWQTNPEPHITWDGLTTLLRATFYPLDAQDNAFTAWNAVEFNGNVSKFFDEVRKTFRTYPISMEHMLSILTFRLGKVFGRKVKTRLASGTRVELSIYELEAIADELLTQDKVSSSSRTASSSNFSSRNIDSSTRAILPKASTPLPQKQSSSSASITPSTSRDSKVVKSALAKKKVAAVETSSFSRNRSCFLCGDPSHFCYQCPDRKLEGCVICGEDHEWQDCPTLEGKFMRKKAVACVEKLFDEFEDLAIESSTEKHAAELSVPNICWQTHEPLCLASVEWDQDTPLRLACMHPPSPSRRLVYRCKVHDKSACCLFDNGANCSLMSWSWAKKHNIPCKLVGNVVKTAVQDNKSSKYMTLPLKFEIGSFRTTWQFFILPQLSHDVFIGTDFTLFHRVTYDPFDWSMIIMGNSMKKDQFPAFLKKPMIEDKSQSYEVDAVDVNESADDDDSDEESVEDDNIEIEVNALCERLPMLNKYRSLFFPVIGNPPGRRIEHNIVLKTNTMPVKHNPYPLPPEKREAMVSQVSELLSNNAIEPSKSSWSSPLLFVKKKDGGWRMCVDFRTVNAVTKQDAYPLPRINVLMQKLGNAKYLTKIDLAFGFHQVPINPNCREITAFCTPEPVKGYSHFQWKVMPFGLVNAPATFQRLMDLVLHDLTEKCVVYLDDILIFSATLDDHYDILREVFERLMEHRLYVKISKCSFVQEEIVFLGHVVRAGEIRIEPAKVQKICGWEPPLRSAKDVRKFWGLVSWCGMYFPHLASVAAPLTSLSSGRRKFIWTTEAEEAMRLIQQKCMEATVLVPWSDECETRVTTDASDVGLGAVLEQKVNDIWRPVEFWSRKLKPAETRYSATDKEWLAVVEAVSNHWRHVLEGREVVVRTDHRPLLGKLSSASSVPPLLHRHARWIERLSPFLIRWEHVSGKDNQIADALSRTPEFYHANAIVVSPEDKLQLKDAIALDDEYQQRAKGVVKSCEVKSSPWFGFSVKDNAIYRPEGTIEVPNVPKFRTALLMENHDHPMSGHFGRDRTLDLLKRKWYWRGMAKDVEEYVQSCDKCQKTKSGRSVLPALQPIVPSRPWSIVTLDFVGSFCPAVNTGHTECLVMVDKFTKMVHLAGCKKEVNAKEAACLVIKHVVALHGIPEEILSDRGPQFDSQVWHDIWNILGARVKLAAPQHPQTDGQSERSIRTFIQLMRAYTESQRDQWEIFLPIFEFAMNNAVSTSTGITPFFANFGRHPRTADALLGGDSVIQKNETVVGRDLRRRLQRVWEVIKEKLKKTADQMIARSSSSRSALEFDSGDKVYLSKKRGRGQLTKQEALYSGPYPIKKKLGKSTYVLGGTPTAVPALQNIRHLRPYSPSPQQFEGREQRVADTPADAIDDAYEVEKIIDHRGVGRHRRYCVKWKDSEENTWLPPGNLKGCSEVLREYLEENGLYDELKNLDNGESKISNGESKISSGDSKILDGELKKSYGERNSGDLMPVEEDVPLFQWDEAE